MGDDILEETEEEFLAGGRRLVKLLTVTCSSNLTHFDILQQWKKQTKNKKKSPKCHHFLLKLEDFLFK